MRGVSPLRHVTTPARATAPWLLPRPPSDPPPPVAAPAVGVPLDVLLVALQRPVLRHAHLLRRRIEALAGVGGLLHLRRKVGHESELLLHVLPRAEPAAGSGMAGDLAVPFQRQRAFERFLPLDRVGG